MKEEKEKGPQDLWKDEELTKNLRKKAHGHGD